MLAVLQTAESRQLMLDCLTVDGCPIDDLELDFVLPGYADIELKKGGKNISVTLDNLEEYVQVYCVLGFAVINHEQRLATVASQTVAFYSQ